MLLGTQWVEYMTQFYQLSIIIFIVFTFSLCHSKIHGSPSSRWAWLNWWPCTSFRRILGYCSVAEVWGMLLRQQGVGEDSPDRIVRGTADCLGCCESTELSSSRMSSLSLSVSSLSSKCLITFWHISGTHPSRGIGPQRSALLIALCMFWTSETFTYFTGFLIVSI